MKLLKVMSCAAAIAAMTLASVASADEVGGNLGFENALGTLNGDPITDPGNWFGFTGPGAVGVGTNTVAPNNGATHGEISFAGSADSFAGFQQFVNGVTAGETYTFSIFASTDGNSYDMINEIRIEWLDATGGALGNTGNITPTFTSAYTQFSQSGVAPAGATALKAVVAAQSFGGSTGNGVARLDDASIQGPAAVVPEPGSIALLGLGALGLISRRRRS